MLTGLPKDPILLLSVVNTKLRDYYPSLDALCDDNGRFKRSDGGKTRHDRLQIRCSKKISLNSG